MKFKSRSLLQQINIEALYNTFLGLQPKEQIYTLVGLGVALLLLIGLPLTLASSKLGGLEKEIIEGREQQREILRELEAYQQIKGQLNQLEKNISQGYDARLTTTIDQLAEESGIKDRIDNIKERGATSTEIFDEISVDVRLTKVTVPQLMDYLYKIEYHPTLFLKIQEIQIKRRYDNKQLLDVPILRVATYRIQKPEG